MEANFDTKRDQYASFDEAREATRTKKEIEEEEKSKMGARARKRLEKQQAEMEENQKAKGVKTEEQIQAEKSAYLTRLREKRKRGDKISEDDLKFEGDKAIDPDDEVEIVVDDCLPYACTKK